MWGKVGNVYRLYPTQYFGHISFIFQHAGFLLKPMESALHGVSSVLKHFFAEIDSLAAILSCASPIFLCKKNFFFHSTLNPFISEPNIFTQKSISFLKNYMPSALISIFNRVRT